MTPWRSAAMAQALGTAPLATARSRTSSMPWVVEVLKSAPLWPARGRAGALSLKDRNVLRSRETVSETACRDCHPYTRPMPPAQPSDQQLIAGLRAGDEMAFRTLVNR